jgi:hypothetical protein
MTPAHASAVAASHYTTTQAVQIKLPGHTINLITESSVVRMLVGTTLTTFTGSDPMFGRIGSVGKVSFSMEASAPVWKVSLMPDTPLGIANLASPAAQGSRVQFWTLVIDPTSGAVVASKSLWRGKIDTQRVSLNADTVAVELDVVTPTDLLMMANEGERLNVAWQDLHWPGQRGLAFVVDAKEQPFWGTDAIRANPSTSYTGGGGYGSGGGGGIGGGGGYVSVQF